MCCCCLTNLSKTTDRVRDAFKNYVTDFLRKWGIPGKILFYAQCPSCPLPFRPSEMPFPQNDLPFNALHQNALSEMPFWKCPFRYVLHQNALSVMPIQICPFKNALSQFALSQFALYQIAVYHKCNIFIYFRL